MRGCRATDVCIYNVAMLRSAQLTRPIARSGGMSVDANIQSLTGHESGTIEKLARWTFASPACEDRGSPWPCGFDILGRCEFVSLKVPSRDAQDSEAACGNYRLGQRPGVATSSECPSGSRKYRLVPPRGQTMRLSTATSCCAKWCSHAASSPNGMANARWSAPRP